MNLDLQIINFYFKARIKNYPMFDDQIQEDTQLRSPTKSSTKTRGKTAGQSPKRTAITTSLTSQSIRVVSGPIA